MRALAQAGNRTSKTALCRQWWDSRLEWRADASGTGNQHHKQLFVSCTWLAQHWEPCGLTHGGLRSQEPFLQQVRRYTKQPRPLRQAADRQLSFAWPHGKQAAAAPAAAKHDRPRNVLGRALQVFRLATPKPKNLSQPAWPLMHGTLMHSWLALSMVSWCNG